MINKQIECMRILKIPKIHIQEILRKYSHINKHKLLNKLIECEEKYENYDKLTQQEIKYNKCDNLNKDCDYFDCNTLKCKLEQDCNECEDYNNIAMVLTEKEMQEDLEYIPEKYKNNEKVNLIYSLNKFEREIVSQIGIQELKAQVKKSKVYEIIKEYSGKKLKEKFLEYSELLTELYGF